MNNFINASETNENSTKYLAEVHHYNISKQIKSLKSEHKLHDHHVTPITSNKHYVENYDRVINEGVSVAFLTSI